MRDAKELCLESALRATSELDREGFTVVNARDVGLPLGREVAEALTPYLYPDTRAIGKRHARDVIHFGADGVATECESIAHVDGTNDYARFWLLDSVSYSVATAMRWLLSPKGRFSVDYFHYSPGSAVGPHRDSFGETIAIWVLSRRCSGAANYLLRDNGEIAFRGELLSDQILLFRDVDFLHGMESLDSGFRDALIFISLRDEVQ